MLTLEDKFQGTFLLVGPSLRLVICLERTGLGAPNSLDALFAQINVKSAPKGGYKKATRVGGDGFRGGACRTEHYFLPRPCELDCSCVTPARWRQGATRDVQIKSYVIPSGSKNAFSELSK